MSEQFQYRCNEMHKCQLEVVAANMGRSKGGCIKGLVNLVYSDNMQLETISREYGMSYLEIIDALIQTAYEEITYSLQEVE